MTQTPSDAPPGSTGPSSAPAESAESTGSAGTTRRRLGWRELRVPAALVLAIAAFQAWRNWQAENEHEALGAQLAAVARPGEIALISSTTCVYCARARAWMTRHEVPFTECFIERETACLQRYQQLGAPGTPVTLLKGRAVLGFNPETVAASYGIAAAAERR